MRSDSAFHPVFSLPQKNRMGVCKNVMCKNVSAECECRPTGEGGQSRSDTTWGNQAKCEYAWVCVNMPLNIYTGLSHDRQWQNFIGSLWVEHYSVGSSFSQLCNGALPLPYRSQTVPELHRKKTLVTVRFQLVSVCHCRRVGPIKALLGLLSDSDIKTKRHYYSHIQRAFGPSW